MMMFFASIMDLMDMWQLTNKELEIKIYYCQAIKFLVSLKPKSQKMGHKNFIFSLQIT